MNNKLFALGMLCLAAAPAIGADVAVRADKRLRKVPYLYRNGNAVNVKPLGYPLEKFFSDQKPGSFYLVNWNYDHYVKNGRSFENLKRSLNDPTTGWNNNIEWMKKISGNGGEINLILGTSYWFGDPGDGAPPHDLDDWERFVRDTVNLFDNELKLTVRYQLWDEPDTEMFRGTLDQYFEVIRRAVIGMKKANPKAKFGGPGSSEFNGRGFKAAPAEKPLIYNFIKYCAGTPLPEVGLKRIPIDYIGWHIFDAEPYTSVARDQADQARAWLREFGYSDKTELNVNSWTRWTGLSERDFNGPFLASYILPMLMAMEEAGISRQVYFNVFDHWLPEAAQSPNQEFFEGGYGLFSRHFIIKPVYNAFQAMGMVQGQRLKVAESDPFITVLAADDGKKVSILISNYAPKNIQPYLLDNVEALRSIRPYAAELRRLRAAGKPEKEAADEVLATITDPLTAKRARAALALRGRLAGKFPGEVRDEVAQLRQETQDAQMKADLDEIVAVLDTAQTRQRAPTEVNLKVSGLGSGTRGYRHFIIDGSHANAYAVRDRIAELAARVGDDKDAGMRAVEEVNNWPEVKLKAEEEPEVRVSGAFEKSLKIQPYSVHLIVLTK